MENKSPDKITILAVDDIPENLDVIKGILVPEYRVKSAINGKTALKIVAKQPPDIILLDIMMPEMDGYEVCQKLKESAATRDIPVIFVTAMDEELDELRGFELGAVDYVRKPISHAILKARVGVQVALGQAQQELQIKNKLLQEDRDFVENIVHKMHSDPHFDQRHLRFSIESMEKTNGDVLFSAFRPDGAQHILLGDFTGHGLRAAVGGPLVAAFFYIRTLDGLGGWELICEINNILNRQLPTGMFMTAALVEVSPKRDSFRIWNSALPDQLLVLDGGSKIEQFVSTLPPLGLLKDMYVEKGEWIDWPDDTKLYLYSDGLVEPMNAEEKMFGVEGVMQLLAQPGVTDNALDDVVEQVKNYAENGEHMDDVTLVEVQK
jgi:two-component system, HptB-dependent secretion and biofilm response regulator